MKPFVLSGGLLLVCYAHARILQLPLRRLDHDSLSRFPDLRASGKQDGKDSLKSIKDQRISKSPLQLGAQDETHQLPVRGWEHLLYLTTIAIGTPPQSFTAAIDIAWTDLFVPSSKCKQRGCHDLWSTYNSSESSTFVANGSEIALHYAGLYTSGIVSQDTVYLGDLSIEAQHFEEALELRPAPGYWGNIFDGVLGLSPPTASGTRNLLHPLSMIVSRGLLDENVFGLRLPSDDNTGGELTLGGTNKDSYTDDLITIPTTSETDPWLHGKWTVEARSAWLGDGDAVNRNLSGYTAFFDSGYPFIDLPRSLAVDALKLIDAKPGNSLVLTVPCSKRDELPDLTFQLHNANIKLTAFNYTIKDDGECAVMIDGHQEHEDEKPYLRLGSSFLKGLYSVFDIDRKTVGFAKVKDPTASTRQSTEVWPTLPGD